MRAVIAGLKPVTTDSNVFYSLIRFFDSSKLPTYPGRRLALVGVTYVSAVQTLEPGVQVITRTNCFNSEAAWTTAMSNLNLIASEWQMLVVLALTNGYGSGFPLNAPKGMTQT